MPTLKEPRENSSFQTETLTLEEKQRLERYERFSRLRDIEIVREMHGLLPKYPALSTQRTDSRPEE